MQVLIRNECRYSFTKRKAGEHRVIYGRPRRSLLFFYFFFHARSVHRNAFDTKERFKYFTMRRCATATAVTSEFIRETVSIAFHLRAR